MKLDGRVAVVTGSATGIGQAIAVALAAGGARVAVNHFGTPGAALTTTTRISEAGGEAMIVEADVARSDQVRGMMEKVAERWGGIDVLVNNAAVQYNLPLLDYPEGRFDRLIDTNLRGYWCCIQAVVPYMKRRGFGRIICISSVHQKRPTEFDAAYAMSKGGVKMLVREAALSLGSYGITVNGIAPGAVYVAGRRERNTTSATARQAEPDATKEAAAYGRPLKQRFPAGRVGVPEDVASLVCWIASQESDYLSGSSIRLDGGSMLT